MRETSRTNKGVRAEYVAYKYYTKIRNSKCVFHRLKSKLAEVDLIFENPCEIILVEVKTLSDDWYAFERLGEDQASRLCYLTLFLRNRFRQKNIRTELAWVKKNQTVSTVDLY